MNDTYRNAQLAYDHRSPGEDDGRQDFIDEQVELLLEADDARDVEFFDFANAADEAISDADQDGEFAVVQIILAVRRGDFTLAEKLALRFEDALIQSATKLVEKELESGDE